MTLYDIIEKAKTQKKEEFDLWTMAEELGLDSCSLENVPEVSPITQYYFVQWFCTDSRVGGSVLFFNDEAVAVASQQGRKCDLNIEWLSKERYLKVYNYIKSLIKEDHNCNILDQSTLDDEWGETYNVDFTGQLLTNGRQFFYNGEEVEYVKDGDAKNCIDKTVYIRLPSGEEKLIDIENLKISFF